MGKKKECKLGLAEGMPSTCKNIQPFVRSLKIKIEGTKYVVYNDGIPIGTITKYGEGKLQIDLYARG